MCCIMAACVKDHQLMDPELSSLLSIKGMKDKLSVVYHSITSEGLAGSDNSYIQSVIGLSNEGMEKCTEKFNPKNILPETGLITLQHIKRSELPQNTGLESLKNTSLENAKKLFHPIPSLPLLPVSLSSSVPCPEIIISIIAFHPFKRTPQAQYQVLSSQRLVQLKDKFYCPRDYAIETDFSDNPNQFDRTKILIPPTPSKSGYFFINDVFYNDKRDPEAEDYSSTVINWASDGERQSLSSRLNSFTSSDMSEVTFEELSVRLGYPYLYCHHGNCEHVIVFHDIRLLTSSDVQDYSLYPLISEYMKDLRKRCHVCDEYTAVWTTFNDTLAIQSPGYYCHSCLKMLHYDKNGQKLIQFRLYPYFDDPTTLLDRAAYYNK